MCVVLLGDSGVRMAELGGDDAIGVSRIANHEAWVCRRMWKFTGGSMPARSEASLNDLVCCEGFQASPFPRLKMWVLPF